MDGALPADFEVGCRLLVPDRVITKEPRMRALGTQKAKSKAGGQEGPSPHMEQKKGSSRSPLSQRRFTCWYRPIAPGRFANRSRTHTSFPKIGSRSGISGRRN